MQLGHFSVSLAVTDLAKSREFYQALGFDEFGGSFEQGWLIMKNGDHSIVLFQGMFEKNMLTFNPGWDANANALSEFTDIRELQRQLKNQGLTFEMEADENSEGPASLMLFDPDGNPVLIDQHV